MERSREPGWSDPRKKTIVKISLLCRLCRYFLHSCETRALECTAVFMNLSSSAQKEKTRRTRCWLSATTRGEGDPERTYSMVIVLDKKRDDASIICTVFVSHRRLDMRGRKGGGARSSSTATQDVGEAVKGSRSVERRSTLKDPEFVEVTVGVAGRR